MAEKVTFNVDKEKDFSGWYSEIIEKAEVADIRYNVKGFVVVRPLGAEIIENMYRMWESELRTRGHKPCIFPTVIPEENFKKESDHLGGFAPEVFWLKPVGDGNLALRPTSETAFYQLYSLWIRSWRDLPLKLYQRANVFRLETKATRPLIRAREFNWIESHDAFSSKKEAEQQVQEDISITEKLMHQRLGIPFLPLKRPAWDRFAGAEYTIGSDSLMPDGKVIQQPSTHLLKQQFAKGFDIKFKDEEGKEKYVWQTCYGPAMSRILSSLISTHGDNSGLITPFCISPIQVIIIPIYRSDNKEKIVKKAREVKEKLLKNGIKAEIDDSEKKPGDKFYYWEMRGIPLRMEIGEKELKEKFTLFLRDKKEKIKADVKDIRRQGEELDKRLREKADKKLKNSIRECETKEEVKKALKNKKIARCSFCSIETGHKCAEAVEKEINAFVRGTRHDKKEKPKGKCLFCNKPAEDVVYIARSY
jgi:prolyl-tRNA synthetase